jgi:(1->4)-alpha-D-glucan 1-alpha-D-glucosylmutase
MHVPLATYRLQLNRSFDLQKAKAVIPYLHQLGISDIYASPVFKAAQGSTHGYDIVDPNELNHELGGLDGFTEVMAEKQKLEMGWLQDIVPNHMAFNSENWMLMDLFEKGRQSRFFSFFDIEWEHPDKALKGKVMVPVLGESYDKTLAGGKIRLELNANGFHVRYYDRRLPLCLSSYPDILEHEPKQSADVAGAAKNKFEDLAGLSDRFASLAGRPPDDTRDKHVNDAKQKLWEIRSIDGPVKKHIENALDFYNGTNSQNNKFGPLKAVLDRQYFKLEFWKKATESINYRRFFYLNDFIGLCVEKKEVCEFTHRLLLRLAREKKFAGLRIDHIDGLYNPTTYLKYLREQLPDTYIIVEKILDAKENLPQQWPVQGTTGYEFADYANKLFCYTENERAFTDIYEQFTGLSEDYSRIVYEKKKFLLRKFMAGDISLIAHLFQSLTEREPAAKATFQDIEAALIEIIAAFDVYRTYINDEKYTKADRSRITKAIEKAAGKSPRLKQTIKLIGRYLLIDCNLTELPEKERILHFIMKFQQLTGPAMAKGFEDTALYNYNRLICLNEVGSQPDCFGISAEEFHEFNILRNKRWRLSLNATSTHDTKRGEDVRARINVLSEIPQLWNSKVTHWKQINEPKKTACNGAPAPDANDEYFLYQTLVGALPFHQTDSEIFAGRIKQYFIKALREAKTRTSWIEQDRQYEDACTKFVGRLIVFDQKDVFWRDFISFQKDVAAYAVYNSLSQVLIKMTAPGIPDFYQGSELWDLNLVDPDNRRPVDFEHRVRLLAEIKNKEGRSKQHFLTGLLKHPEDGSVKMFLIRKVLAARRKYRHVFENGDYLPLPVSGEQNNHIVAFARKCEAQTAIVVAPRFLASLISPAQLPVGDSVWKDTRVIIPEHTSDSWVNVVTNEQIRESNELPAGQLFGCFPAALLVASK